MIAPEPGRASPAILTPRERDCLRLVLENHSSKEIGRRLGISPASVDTHLRRVRTKLGVNDRYAAARWLAAHESRAAAASPLPPASDAAPAPRRGLLPPMEELGVLTRLALVILCAIVLAAVFGLGLIILRML